MCLGLGGGGGGGGGVILVPVFLHTFATWFDLTIDAFYVRGSTFPFPLFRKNGGFLNGVLGQKKTKNKKKLFRKDDLFCILGP